jgi:hypothetical protein
MTKLLQMLDVNKTMLNHLQNRNVTLTKSPNVVPAPKQNVGCPTMQQIRRWKIMLREFEKFERVNLTADREWIE